MNAIQIMHWFAFISVQVTHFMVLIIMEYFIKNTHNVVYWLSFISTQDNILYISHYYWIDMYAHKPYKSNADTYDIDGICIIWYITRYQMYWCIKLLDSRYIYLSIHWYIENISALDLYLSVTYELFDHPPLSDGGVRSRVGNMVRVYYDNTCSCMGYNNYTTVSCVFYIHQYTIPPKPIN